MLTIIRGPATALAYAIAFFAFAWCRSDTQALRIKNLVNWPLFWLSKLDGHLIDKPGAYDFAAAFAYFGMKDDVSLTDEEILAKFQGRGMDA